MGQAQIIETPIPKVCEEEDAQVRVMHLLRHSLYTSGRSSTCQIPSKSKKTEFMDLPFDSTAPWNHAGSLTALRKLDLPIPIAGALWLSGLPVSGGHLSHFRDEIAAKDITQLVVLTEDHEIRALAPNYARLLSSGVIGPSVIRLPIRDFGVPESPSEFRHAAQDIAASLQQGARIVMHCRGGIGRTGLMACAVLTELGLPIDEAIVLVAAAGSKCETTEQTAFLRKAYDNAED
ncbi:MAG: dual specificity protein phosphatase family protein [Rhodobacteraceae bacterium]|nr:dual specificity protein phosphatase family protein [Paracoccaceae bacterium]